MSAPTVYFIGNATCLDLVNSRGPVEAQDGDAWIDAPHILTWCRSAGVLEPSDVTRVQAVMRSPVEAARFLADARRLREECRAACEAIVSGDALAPATLALLNGYLNARGAHCELSYERDRLVRHVRSPLETPAHVLSLLADHAATFFTTCNPAQLRRCARPGCALWFLDTSRNGRRRWCSMQACGAVDKMRRYRARRAQAG